MYRYLLIFRFVLLNAACFGVLGAAWLQGWVDAMLRSSARLMCLGIFATFLVGLVTCALKIVRTSLDLDHPDLATLPMTAGRIRRGAQFGDDLADVLQRFKIT